MDEYDELRERIEDLEKMCADIIQDNMRLERSMETEFMATYDWISTLERRLPNEP